MLIGLKFSSYHWSHSTAFLLRIFQVAVSKLSNCCFVSTFANPLSRNGCTYFPIFFSSISSSLLTYSYLIYSFLSKYIKIKQFSLTWYSPYPLRQIQMKCWLVILSLSISMIQTQRKNMKGVYSKSSSHLSCR